MSFNSITGYLTGGLIDPSTPNYAGAANQANLRQQQQIDQGMQALNSVYFGGSYPSYSKVGKGATYNPGMSYSKYNPRTGYTPYTPKFAKVKSGMRQLPLQKGGLGQPKNFKNLYQTTQSPYQTGFTPAFYSGIANDYIQSALPQLAQQQKQTSDSLQYGLYNKGLTPGSSAYASEMSNLNQSTGQAEQQVADNAQNAANSMQQSVMQSYNNAINQLYQTANPAQAAQSAVGSAAQFTVPQTFAPLTNMFSSLANQYATSQLYNPGNQTGYGTNPYASFYPYGATQSGGGSGGSGGSGGNGILGPTATY